MRWDDTDIGKEWAKTYHQKYYLKNKEKLLKQQKDRIDSDPDFKARKNYMDRKRDADAKKIIYDVLGGPKCIHCGYDKDIRALQLDHINGGGSKDRKSNRSTSKIVRRYKADLSQLKLIYQVLCANCNVIKKYENNET